MKKTGLIVALIFWLTMILGFLYIYTLIPEATIYGFMIAGVLAFYLGFAVMGDARKIMEWFSEQKSIPILKDLKTIMRKLLWRILMVLSGTYGGIVIVTNTFNFLKWDERATQVFLVNSITFSFIMIIFTVALTLKRSSDERKSEPTIIVEETHRNTPAPSPLREGKEKGNNKIVTSPRPKVAPAPQTKVRNKK